VFAELDHTDAQANADHENGCSEPDRYPGQPRFIVRRYVPAERLTEASRLALQLDRETQDAEKRADDAEDETAKAEDAARAADERAELLESQLAPLAHDVLRYFGAAREDVPFQATTTAWQQALEEAVRSSDYSTVKADE